MDCFTSQYLKISILSSQREFNATKLWHGGILVDHAIKKTYITYIKTYIK